MNKLQGFGVARVEKAASVAYSTTGAPFLLVVVKFDERALDGGRKFSQRVEIKSFQRGYEDLLPLLTPGVLISFTGEVDAEVEEVRGKHYANPRLTGRIELVKEEQ